MIFLIGTEVNSHHNHCNKHTNRNYKICLAQKIENNQ